MSEATDRQSTCPICNAAIAADKLMCRKHWARVPEGLKKTVNATWRRYSRSTGYEALSSRKAYFIARKAAIDAVGGELLMQESP